MHARSERAVLAHADTLHTMEVTGALQLVVVGTAPQSRLAPGVVFDWDGASSSVEIGRDASCGVCVPDGTVSRCHARLHCQDTRFLVEAVSASNGTFLDGERLQVRTRHELVSGARLQLGGLLFEIATSQATVAVLESLEEQAPALSRSAGAVALEVTWDAQFCTVAVGGQLVKLQPLPAKALGLLLERPGEVVHRWDLIEALGAGTNLAQVASQIRTALLECVQHGTLSLELVRARVAEHHAELGLDDVERMDLRTLMRHLVAARRGHGYRICIAASDVVARQV